MFALLYKLSIKFLKWDLNRMGIDTLELVIRNDGNTVYKRDKEKENSIKKTLNLLS